MANYFWYALSAITGAIISGILVDKYTAHSIAVVTQLPMLFATLLLWFGNNFVTLIFFFIFFGIGSGMLQPMINSLLAERYGTKWIGEIKSLAMPLNVIASAASPIVMGLMIDAGSGLSELMTLLICSVLTVRWSRTSYSIYGVSRTHLWIKNFESNDNLYELLE